MNTNVVETRLDDPNPFPVDVLPAQLKEFVTQTCQSMCCPLSYLAVPMLSVLAGAIGNSCRLQIKDGYTVPSAIWTATVGESGTMKSPAFKVAIKGLRDALIEQLNPRKGMSLVQSNRYGKPMDGPGANPDPRSLEEILADPETDVETKVDALDRSGAKRKTMADFRKERQDNSGNDADILAELPQDMRRVITSDTTIPALAQLLATNPRGLLVASEELNRWFKGIGRDSGSWLELFDAGDLCIDRKLGPFPNIFIPDALASVTGTIQPEILRQTMGAAFQGSGLLARMLFAMPPRMKKVWTDVSLDVGAQSRYQGLLSRLLEIRMERWGTRLSPLILRFNPDSKSRWVDFYEAHQAEAATLSGNLAAAWSKLEAYAGRIALVLEFAEWAEKDPGVAEPERVNEVNMVAGIELARWFGREIRRVYDMALETPETAERRNLIEWIVQRGGITTVRQLTHNHARYKQSPALAKPALDNLVNRGMGRWEFSRPTQLGGRPSEVFVAD